MNDYDLPSFATDQQILGEFPFKTTWEALGKGVINTQLPNGSNIEWLFSDCCWSYPGQR